MIALILSGTDAPVKNEPGHGAGEEELCSLMLIDNRMNQVIDVWVKTELSKPNSTAFTHVFKDRSKNKWSQVRSWENHKISCETTISGRAYFEQRNYCMFWGTQNGSIVSWYRHSSQSSEVTHKEKFRPSIGKWWIFNLAKVENISIVSSLMVYFFSDLGVIHKIWSLL